MFLPLLLVHLGGPVGTDPGMIYNGRAGSIDVRAPRLDAKVTVDGKLDEPEWSQAALLTGFSQFSPLDGIPAADSTEVFVWYSPDAVYFGIRAFEAHGAVHATLADRDKIGSDDYVQILLSTFDDGRQATVLAVNPYGVQSDGALVETGSTSGNGFNTAMVQREAADLSPDYVFESKGRLTDYGYEVEVRVPFKSLRFQPAKEQRWGINITRKVQHSGQEDSWAPAKRASASFLSQSGHLVGLTDLQRGLVLDLNPSLTSKTTGGPSSGGWDYSGGGPELGGSVRWGITNNLNLNGTANPDFSQVESDAGQFLFDPRDEVFFQEKRPVLSRWQRAVQRPQQPDLYPPDRAAGGCRQAHRQGSRHRHRVSLGGGRSRRCRPRETIRCTTCCELQRDFGGKHAAGDGLHRSHRGDQLQSRGGSGGRWVKGAYSAQLQLAGSRTTTAGVTTTAPLIFGRVIANGRTLGSAPPSTARTPTSARAADSSPGPATPTPTSSRGSRSTVRPGACMENLTVDVNLDGLYRWDQFATYDGMQEEKIHLNANLDHARRLARRGLGADRAVRLSVRGLHRLPVGAAASPVEASTRSHSSAATRFPTRITSSTLDTPEFSHFSGSFFYLWGHDENFFEWASGKILWIDARVSTGGPPTSCGSARTRAEPGQPADRRQPGRT